MKTKKYKFTKECPVCGEPTPPAPKTRVNCPPTKFKCSKCNRTYMVRKTMKVVYDIIMEKEYTPGYIAVDPTYGDRIDDHMASIDPPTIRNNLAEARADTIEDRWAVRRVEADGYLYDDYMD